MYMQLSTHPPTWAASFTIIIVDWEVACIRRASTNWRREETQATIWSAHGGSIAVRAKRGVKHISSHQLAEVRVEIWLVVADAHITYTFKLGCAQLLQIWVANNL